MSRAGYQGGLAKTPAACEINNIAAGSPPAFCYKHVSLQSGSTNIIIIENQEDHSLLEETK